MNPCEVCGAKDHPTNLHATVQLLLSWELLYRAGLEDYVSPEFRTRVQELGAATSAHLDDVTPDSKALFIGEAMPQPAITTTA